MNTKMIKKGRILIVIADTSQQEWIEKTVNAEGYTTRSVSNASEALEVISEWVPNIILIDVDIPEMDGFKTVSTIRHFDRFLYLPILLMPSRATMEDKRKGVEAGADDIVIKPFSQEELLLRISIHLRRYRHSSDAERYIPKRTIKVPIMLPHYKSGIFRRWFQITKRVFDFFFALVQLPFALPVMIGIVIAIRIDSPGPVMFFQERTGLNGKRFKMLKFRTMLENADELKLKYEHLNELTWPDFKITNDPRMTKVGRMLRKTSLDELPQLINILIGDMSFVGPRPTSFKAETYKLWQTERLEVRPGLTGLWQVSGRSDVDFIERAEMDIDYIERQSWRLDLKVMWQTLSAVFHGKGAY
ncbi:sugar transferase [Desulfobacter latus]|uniref:Sugar transferase n=2 Tax=Desulfobacter latus TaxID=2292 RepID=A0A850SZ43_9BACT|nr:sugar transferase [Desulfobacter latus]